MAVDPDQELVEAAQAGDAAALEALLRRHHDRVHLLCRRLTGSDADALDATQEALIAVVRGLPRFDGRSRFTTWLHRVATNACLDELRRRRRRPRPGLPDDADDDGHPHHEVADPRGEEGLHAVAERLVLDEALAGLPVEFRAAVVLRDVCDLDYAEIAEVLDVPPGTVRSRIARGRRLLARQLDPPASAGNQAHPPDRPSTTAPEPPTPPQMAP